jgi:uncharacterized protein (DUF1330 family)
MTAYLIVDLDVHDWEGFQAYRNGVGTFVRKYGGEYIVRGGDYEVLEGGFQPHRLVMFAFPDRAAIKAMYDDPDYKELAKIRESCARSVAIAVDGI